MNDQLEQWEKIAEENYSKASTCYQEASYIEAIHYVKISTEAYMMLCEKNGEYYIHLVDCYCLHAQICLFGALSQPDTAIECLDMAIAALKKATAVDSHRRREGSLNNYLDRGDCYYKVAMLFEVADQVEKARTSYREASGSVDMYVLLYDNSCYEEETLSLDIRCHIGISDMLIRQNKYTEALHYCQLATELFEENPDVELEDWQSTEIDLLLAYGDASEGLGNYRQAEEYFRAAFNNAKELFISDDGESGSDSQLRIAGASLQLLYNSGKIEGDSRAISKLIAELLGK